MINLLLLLTLLQAPVRSVSSSHVTVYRPLNVDAAIARGYLSALEQLYVTYSNRLEIGRNGKLRVRLCRDRYDFASLTGADSGSSPLWKEGTLYIIARDDINDPGYNTRLAVGVIRGVLNSIAYNGAPPWLVYAVAVYESGQYKGLTPPPVETVKYFSDLEERMQSASSPTDVSDLIFYLGNTGKYLDTKFGVGSLMRLLHQFDHVTSFADAVSGAYHIDLQELEQDWHEYLVNVAGQ
jgi:hypothetical protein